MRKQETTFIGKITAGVTHELMNVFATIMETSGLMEDLLASEGKTLLPHREKFLKILITIQKQVTRGMEISERLNTFAHSMDESKAWVEINELLDQLAFLMHRFAMLKKVQVTVSPGKPPLSIYSDPFRLQLIIVAGIEYCLDHTSSGGVITLQSLSTREGIVIKSVAKPFLKPVENSDGLPDELSDIHEILGSIGARLHPVSVPGQQGLELILPTDNQ